MGEDIVELGVPGSVLVDPRRSTGSQRSHLRLMPFDVELTDKDWVRSICRMLVLLQLQLCIVKQSVHWLQCV